MTCYNCATSTAASTKTESNTCHSSIPTADCTKEGSGYARITYCGDNTSSCNSQPYVLYRGTQVGSLVTNNYEYVYYGSSTSTGANYSDSYLYGTCTYTQQNYKNLRYILFSNPIDLTNFSSIKVTGNYTSSGYHEYFVRAYSSKPSTLNDNYTHLIGSGQSDTHNQNFEHTSNINLSGSYYIVVSLKMNNDKIYSIEFN